MYIRKEKWLFICMYSPNTKYKHICCDVLDSLLDIARSNAISNIHVLADLNINLFNTIESKCLDVVIETHGLKNVITEPTCHKSSNATLIDVILTSNRIWWLYRSTLVEVIEKISSANWPLGSGIVGPFKWTGNHTYLGLKNNWGMQSKNGFQNLWGNILFFILC